MKIKTVSGEGETARDALEALAFSLRDDEIDGSMMIRVRRSSIRRLGRSDTYDGFVAEVVAARSRGAK